MDKQGSLMRGVLFDLDGTLIHLGIDYEAQRAAVKKMFVDHGVPADWPFKPILAQIGEATEFLVSKGHTREGADHVRNTAFALIDQFELLGAKRSKPLPGAKELLSRLKKENLRIGIFSRTGREAVHESLKVCGFPEFDFISARQDTEKQKPDASQVLQAIRAWNITADDLLVVGDHIYDMIAGKAAGAHCIAVSTGVSKKDALLNAGAEHVLASLIDLPVH